MTISVEKGFPLCKLNGGEEIICSIRSEPKQCCIKKLHFFPYSSPQGLIYRTVRHDPHIYKTRKAGDCVLFPSCHTKFAFLSEHCLKKLPAFILAVSRGLFREGPGWCLWNTHFVCSCALNLLKFV